MSMKDSIYLATFKLYWRVQRRVHPWVVARFCTPLFRGLHPCNVFNYNNEFFEDNVSREDVVLDIACGTGKLLHALAPKIARGMGVEINKANLSLCRTLHAADNITYLEQDLFKVDYRRLKAELKYTTATYSHILEHVEDVPELLPTVDAEKILVSVPSEENWSAQLAKHFHLPYKTDPSHFREYTRPRLAEDVERAGYRVEYMGFNPEGHINCRATKKR